MKILKYLLIAIGAIVLLVLVVALFIPNEYHVTRSVSIQAPQPVIMDQVKSLKKMNEWSPFTEQDPNMQITYAGTEGQVGSSSSWKSEKVGSGSQTITKLTSDRMETRLEFKEPMEGTGTSYFQTANEGNAVKATWGMQGRNPYPFNVMCLFMDNMIGKEYEKGLAKLKTKCEGMAKGTANANQ
jgi:hypothetical protein